MYHRLDLLNSREAAVDVFDAEDRIVVLGCCVLLRRHVVQPLREVIRLVRHLHIISTSHYAWEYTRLHMYVYVRVYMYMYVRVYMYMCVCVVMSRPAAPSCCRATP